MQGIYSYTNKANGKIYIGQSTNLSHRPRQHKHFLKKGIHGNPHFQASVDKYGFDKFIFEIITCGPFGKEDLTELEQYYIDKYKTEGKTLYNMLPIAGSRTGFTVSIETRKKQSESAKGNRSHLGFKHSEETKKIIGEFSKGRKDSEETSKRRSLAKIGNKNSLGYKQPKETIEKRIASIRKRKEEKRKSRQEISNKENTNAIFQ